MEVILKQNFNKSRQRDHSNFSTNKGGLTVEVRNGDFTKALRIFKKKGKNTLSQAKNVQRQKLQEDNDGLKSYLRTSKNVDIKSWQCTTSYGFLV